MKSNSKSYLEHLRNYLILAMKEFCPNNNFISIQDNAPSHCAKFVQDFLWEELKLKLQAYEHHFLQITSGGCF